MSVSVLEVTSLHATPVVPLNGSVTLSTVSGDTIYYGQDQTVSSSNNTGSLTSGGGSVTLTTQGWVRSAGVSAMQMVSGSALQDVVLGNDGTVGGPGGTGLTTSVAITSSPNTFTADTDGHTPITLKAHSATQSADLLSVQDSSSNPFVKVGPKGAMTLAPSRLDAASLQLTIPALDGIGGVGGLAMTDAATSKGHMVYLYHSASGVNPGSGGLSAALNVRALSGNEAGGSGSGAGPAMLVHGYTNAAAIITWDNTQAQPLLTMRNAQNSTMSPGTHGTGDFIHWHGYFGSDTSSTATITGTTALNDATAAFAAEDVGKPIVVAGANNTIASVTDANNLVLGTPTSNASGVAYSYAKLPVQTGGLTAGLAFINYQTAGHGWTFQTSAGQATALQVTQAAGSQTGLRIDNASTGNALLVNQTGAGAALQVNGVATKFTSVFTGNDNGVKITTSANSGNTLYVEKDGTGGGVAVLFINKGTGDGTQWQIGSTPTTGMKFTALGSLVVGQGAQLATTATDGFVYLPSCAGTPTGVPTTQTGSNAAVYDTTNHKLWVYDAGWKGVVLA